MPDLYVLNESTNTRWEPMRCGCLDVIRFS